jgi:hypothetical protein
MVWALVCGALVLMVAGGLLRSMGGQDRLARWVASERLEVLHVAGVDAGSAAARELFAYRCEGGALLAGSREEAARWLAEQGGAAQLSCISAPRRVVALGQRRWGVMVLSARWAWLGVASCEHGGDHAPAEARGELEEALIAAQAGDRSLLRDALPRATVFIVGFEVSGDRVRLETRVFGGRAVIVMFSDEALARRVLVDVIASPVAFSDFIAVYQPGLPVRVNGGVSSTIELSVEELVAMKAAG